MIREARLSKESAFDRALRDGLLIECARLDLDFDQPVRDRTFFRVIASSQSQVLSPDGVD